MTSFSNDTMPTNRPININKFVFRFNFASQKLSKKVFFQSLNPYLFQFIAEIIPFLSNIPSLITRKLSCNFSHESKSSPRSSYSFCSLTILSNLNSCENKMMRFYQSPYFSRNFTKWCKIHKTVKIFPSN